MRMGHPIRVWDNTVSHTCMGVPYEYTHMGRPIRVWDNTVSHMRMGIPYQYTHMGRPIRVWAGICMWGRTLTILAMIKLVIMYTCVWFLSLCDTKVEVELSFVGYIHFVSEEKEKQ